MAEVVSIGDLAGAAGLSVSRVRQLADDGTIPSTRTTGGHRRFDLEEALAALAGRPAARKGVGHTPAGAVAGGSRPEAGALEFEASRVTVRLKAQGTDFVSRAEARRLLEAVEDVVEVVVDFDGVDRVGPGFADEVFRVWSRAHPKARVHAQNTKPSVAYVVDRAKP